LFQPIRQELLKKEFNGILEGDFQIAEGKMKGMGVRADLGTKGDRGQDTSGLDVGEMGCGAVKRCDEVQVDRVKVCDCRNEGEEVAIYKLLLGVPNLLVDLVDNGILVWVRSCANAWWIVEKMGKEGGIEEQGSRLYGGGEESDRRCFFRDEDRSGVSRWWGW
jgi:hypothetical protein